ncbi:anillin-like isoform X2 [Aricia agestis]|uniref:anillin-like isoform X2 n=1 Tax=Aricia agestis TaxID=91739 RepID=UPI001C20BB9C|nr:anillin-like isoform X2 [Aricia agestis]
MDPFTQRMLERARARQEKIDQKLANSGQVVPKRKPLTENAVNKTQSPVKSPLKSSHESKATREISKADKSSPKSPRSDVVVTKREFQSPRRASGARRNSDVSVEINISHRNDIQIEVQVEERDAPIAVLYNPAQTATHSNVIIKEVEDDTSTSVDKNTDMADTKADKAGLRHNVRSRLDKLANLYSDKPLSSPIHQTEQDFALEPQQPTTETAKPKTDNKKKFGRLAALADQINNWEDDLTHHTFQPESKSAPSKKTKEEKLEASTLDVSIHSINDISRVLRTTPAKSSKPKPKDAHTFVRPAVNECQRLEKKIVAELEGEGFRRSAGRSRLVYDFAPTPDPDRQDASASAPPGAVAAPDMAAMAVSNPTVAKKPSIKKYKAPTPPGCDEICDSERDKENKEEAEAERAAGEGAPAPEPPAGSPRRFPPRLNGADRSSVLSKAAMFEAGSPRGRDPAEMSLRERKALFEKNKGAAIVPKAPFGLAPSAKALHPDSKDKPAKPVQAKTPTKSNSEKNSRTNSNSSLADDNISQSSLGGGIKGKLAALFNKEQTISETTIANKFKQERDKEMAMLQNRFHYKKPQKDESDEEHSEHEGAPLMGSAPAAPHRKPEIVANIPKTQPDHDAARADQDKIQDDKVVGAQPVKRRSSQDSQIVLNVLEEVKRVKVNGKEAGAGQGAGLYPRLPDADRSDDDCAGSSVEDIPDKLNKSDNWAETSFGREVMNIVKRNNSSYKKAVASESESEYDSELDDLLDEALDDEGPTPPKQNKEQGAFRSPLKTTPAAPATPATPAAPPTRAHELVHSVSFYRRMQANSTPSTPVRTIRHASPEHEATPSEPPAAVTVRQRIKELQAEINKQNTVISQASQALNLCAATVEFSGSTEQAEGERLLLLATHRRQACVHEVQRLQVEGAGPAAAAGAAELRLSGIRIPLRRDYVRQLHADGAVGHHAVCLLKCRDRVLATSMQLTSPQPLHFADDVRMDGLASDFKVTVEVYLLQASKELLPHDVKYHISNKKGNSKLLTPKSKVSELKTPRVQSPAGPGAVRAPQFQLHGYCIFALAQASRRSFTLNKVPAGSPLEGALHVDISARVRRPPPQPHAAFLTAYDDVSGLGAWHRRWFRLEAPVLSYWKYPEDVQKKIPIGDIDLSAVVSERVVAAPRDLCARPHTLLLETLAGEEGAEREGGSLVLARGPDGRLRRRHLLAADGARDRDLWLTRLNDALEYVRCTQPADADQPPA